MHVAFALGRVVEQREKKTEGKQTHCTVGEKQEDQWSIDIRCVNAISRSAERTTKEQDGGRKNQKRVNEREGISIERKSSDHSPERERKREEEGGAKGYVNTNNQR